MSTSQLELLAIMAGALAGGGLFLFIAAVRGLPPKPGRAGPGPLERFVKDLFSIRGAVAVIVGIVVLVITRWVVAGVGMAMPASTRVADGSIRDPLARLVDRLHTRVPMHMALRRFAEDLDDPSADMIIAALIINRLQLAFA